MPVVIAPGCDRLLIEPLPFRKHLGEQADCREAADRISVQYRLDQAAARVFMLAVAGKVEGGRGQDDARASGFVFIAEHDRYRGGNFDGLEGFAGHCAGVEGMVEGDGLGEVEDTEVGRRIGHGNRREGQHAKGEQSGTHKRTDVHGGSPFDGGRIVDSNFRLSRMTRLFADLLPTRKSGVESDDCQTIFDFKTRSQVHDR